MTRNQLDRTVCFLGVGAAVACVFMGVTSINGPYYTVSAYVGSGVLLFAALYMAVCRRFAISAGMIVTLLCFVIISTRCLGVGSHRSRFRLEIIRTSVHKDPANAANKDHALKVFLSEYPAEKLDDIPCDFVQASKVSEEYSFQATVRFTTRDSNFSGLTYSWRVPESTIITIETDSGQRFRFPADTLYPNPSASVRNLPKELSATLNLDDYVSGAKKPSANEWTIVHSVNHPSSRH